MYLTALIVFSAKIVLANTAKIKTHIAAAFTYFEDANCFVPAKSVKEGLCYYAYLRLYFGAHFL